MSRCHEEKREWKTGGEDALMRLKRLAGSLAIIRPPDFIVNAMEIHLRILIEK